MARRFLPGEILAGRYRIVAPLGQGGMAQVFRAEDMQLGQTVALKFLPPELARDEKLRSRLLDEIKLARQIAHPNVCRMFDVGEVGGQLFLSMEFIEGEDLASMLRRIGRLPQEKAVQIAGELCAGLAAAHAEGILHRDLKPANLMIDQRGRARITDFGLAALAGEIGGAEVFAGTPAYMAPEQVAGSEVSIRSDLYGLGLVLYELFTGRRAFEAPSPEALRHLQEESSPPPPSDLVQALDPAVERLILECLEKDPALRPPSALSVAARLPGRDPLAAALAAGETPSPEMVAEAGGVGELESRVALGFLTAGALLLALLLTVSPRARLSQLVPLPRSPQVLADRAREMVRSLGLDGAAVDSAHAFEKNGAYFAHVARTDRSPGRWDGLARGDHGPVYFWFRQSPGYLAAGADDPLSWEDPPHDLPGMVGLKLDPSGRLRLLQAVPPATDPAGEPVEAVDWHELFSLAGLDPAQFQLASPLWLPPSYADQRLAWTGPADRGREGARRVEAASYRGRPVYFRLVEDWTEPPGALAPASLGERAARIVWLALLLSALATGGVLARRNLRLGRGDRKGARRVAVGLWIAYMLWWVLSAHHVPARTELDRFLWALASAFFGLGLGWIFYMAIEPTMRRIWPKMLISWSRLLNGRVRDPLVGRHVLIGTVAGLADAMLHMMLTLVPVWLSRTQPRPDIQPSYGLTLEVLNGLRFALAGIPEVAFRTLWIGLIFCTVAVVVRILLRRTWLTVVALLPVMSAVYLGGGGDPWLTAGFTLLSAGLFMLVILRYGLLPLLVTSGVRAVAVGYPLTWDLSTWYSESTGLALVTVAGLLIYGFRVSMAGRTLLTGDLIEN